MLVACFELEDCTDIKVDSQLQNQLKSHRATEDQCLGMCLLLAFSIGMQPGADTTKPYSEGCLKHFICAALPNVAVGTFSFMPELRCRPCGTMLELSNLWLAVVVFIAMTVLLHDFYMSGCHGLSALSVSRVSQG